MEYITESTNQDQSASMCGLILVYTFRKIYSWSGTKTRIQVNGAKEPKITFGNKRLYKDARLTKISQSTVHSQ